MPATPPDFHSAAKLVENLSRQRPDKDEALTRTIVSRAYYWAYHEALALADKLQLPRPPDVKGGVHEEVIARLHSGGDKVSAATKRFLLNGAGNLKLLRDRRVVADYRLDQTVDALRALQDFNTAVRVVEALKQVEKP